MPRPQEIGNGIAIQELQRDRGVETRVLCPIHGADPAPTQTLNHDRMADALPRRYFALVDQPVLLGC